MAEKQVYSIEEGRKLLADKGKRKNTHNKPRINYKILSICDELTKQGIAHTTEFKFHQVRKWRFDIYIPAIKTGIEYNGSQYTNGRHTRGVGYGKDLEKINAAQIQGYKILQYTTSDFGKEGRGAYGVVQDVKIILGI